MPNSNSNSNSNPPSSIAPPWESNSNSNSQSLAHTIPINPTPAQDTAKLDWLAKLNKSHVPIQTAIPSPTPIETHILTPIQNEPKFDPALFGSINVVKPIDPPAADLDYNSVFANVVLPIPSEDRLLTDAEIPSAPPGYKAPVEVPLVEQGPIVTAAEYVSLDKDQPTFSEDEYYAGIVEEMRLSNPTEADLILRLKLYQSQYVGLITTPEQACAHIIACRADKVPIGGHEPVELPPQSTSLAHKQYIERRYAPHRAKKAVVDKARDDWKKAVAERAAVVKQWDEYVQWFHKNYNLVKSLPPASFLTAAVEPEVPTILENTDNESE